MLIAQQTIVTATFYYTILISASFYMKYVTFSHLKSSSFPKKFDKVVLFGQKMMNSGKKVVFGQKWFYSGKSGCIRAKVVALGQKWLYLGKVVVLGQKWLNSGKSGCICVKVVVIGRKWFYSGKSGCTRA